MRGNANDNNGWVRWPLHVPGIRNSHEGGMSAYAFWPELHQDWGGDAFYLCSQGFGIKASLHETNISSLRQIRENNLLAAVCLGTSGGSWEYENEGRYWEATLADIHERGALALDAISTLYGRKPVLVTVLDT